ncbi:hypothetical protein QE152_g24765 [Popillia japonica]|uniref:Uncharacterized protein n=1 Tax=Popillia japonica TaxID=7064 RepID=A0AAW1K3B9_POPJA
MPSETRTEAEKKKFIKSIMVVLKEEDVVSLFIEKFSQEVERIVNKKFSQEVERIVNKKFDVYDKKIRTLEEQNKMLSDKIELAEQYSRRNNLRINGFETVNQDDAEKKVLRLFNEKLQLTTTQSEIDRCHAVGPVYDGKQALMVKFVNYKSRKSIAVMLLDPYTMESKLLWLSLSTTNPVRVS